MKEMLNRIYKKAEELDLIIELLDVYDSFEYGKFQIERGREDTVLLIRSALDKYEVIYYRERGEIGSYKTNLSEEEAIDEVIVNLSIATIHEKFNRKVRAAQAQRQR